MDWPCISHRKQKHAVLSVNAAFITHTLPVPFASSALKQVGWVPAFPGPALEGVSGCGFAAGWGRAAGRTDGKTPFRLDQPTPQPCGCMAASAGAASPRTACPCACPCACRHACPCLRAGRGRGGAGGGRERGDCGFKWVKLHLGWVRAGDDLSCISEGHGLPQKYIQLTLIAVFVVSQGQIQGFFCAIALPESGIALFYSEYI